MEDESDEWMTEEYYSPSSKQTNTSKLRWILNKGCWLGKKVAITGIVISSAPVVLPPLVVISALGFAFLVPFGLVFASYACTEKFMSKLLRSPTFEFEMDSSEEEEEEDGAGVEGEFVMEEEEKEQMEDVKRGVEMRIELDEPVSEELGVDDSKNGDEYRPNVIDDHENESSWVTDENVMVGGYEEGVGEYLVDEEKPEEIFRSEEREYEEPLVEVTQVMIVVEGSDELMGDEEEVEIVRESTGLLQRIRDRGEVDRGVKEASTVEDGGIEMKKEIIKVSEEPFDDKSAFLENLDDGRSGKFEKGFNDRDVEVEKVNGEVKRVEKEFEDNNVKSDEFGREEKENDGKKIDETTLDADKRNIKEDRGDENVKFEKLNREVNETGASTSEQKKLDGKVKRRRGKKRGKANLDERKLNDGTLDEEKAGHFANTENIVLKPNEDTREVNGESIEGSGKIVSEEHKAIDEKKSEYKYNVEGLSAEEKEIAIDQIDNAREAAEERGSDVGDDRRAEGVPYSERLGENNDTRDSTAKEITVFLELPLSKGSETKYTEIAPEPDSPSNEVLLSEEKLWQQIDALRAIVGYKAAHGPSLIMELKALYIFTGVEPPSSFKESRDLVEVNEKLRFLMSVVGVK